MIERLIIDNYKSIRHADVTLKDINIIIGCNGVGKSNLISFFELQQNLLIQRLGSYVLSNGGANRLLYNGSKYSTHVSGIIDFDNTNAWKFTLKPTIDDKLYIEESGDYYNRTGVIGKDYSGWTYRIWDSSVMESNLWSIDKAHASFLKKYMTSFTVFHFHDTSKTSPMRMPSNMNDNTVLRADGSNLASVLYRIQQSDEKTFLRIEAVIKNIAPYFLRFRLKQDSYNPENIRLEWEEKESDMYLDAMSLSDGTLRFIALATVLMQPELSATVIIDEPELGLHPSAISILSNLVKQASRRAQIIISTQSVNLLNYFDADNVLVADRIGGQSVFRRLNTDELKEWSDTYSLGDIWEKNIIGGQP